MAISNFEESIKYGIERALYQPIADGLSVFEWAKIGMNSPRWISVKDRLPEEGKFVLVTGNLYPNKHDGGIMAVSKRLDVTYWAGFGRTGSITHWMPLPEPPEEST